MTIQITKPEVEALINQRLQSGVFKDAEDVILQALQSAPPPAPRSGPPETCKKYSRLQEAWVKILISAAIRPPDVRWICREWVSPRY